MIAFDTSEILITGGNGFIGSNFEYGYKLTRKDVNLLDLHATVEFFKNFKPRTVIHTAGKIGGIAGNRSAKGEYYLENILINTHVLEACRQAGVKRIISLLSTCIYPVAADIPYKESDLHNGEPFGDHFGYAYAKRMLAVQSQAYQEQYGGNYLCLVLPNIYGPGDHMDFPQGHVIPSLVSRLLNCMRTGDEFVVWGTGKPLREVMYVKDLVKLVGEFIIRLRVGAIKHSVINIGPGAQEEYSIRDIAYAIACTLGYRGNIRFNTTMPDGQFRKPSDTGIRELYLPDFEYTSLASGLSQWLYYDQPELKVGI